MSAELIVLSVVAAAAALIVTRVLSLRADARGDARSTGRARDVLGRGGTAAHRSGPAEGGPMSERARQEIHHVPASRGGKTYDPRPLEDKARRSIAYTTVNPMPWTNAVQRRAGAACYPGPHPGRYRAPDRRIGCRGRGPEGRSAGCL